MIVDISPGSIEGVWRWTPEVFRDDRGSFLEWFKGDAFVEATGQSFDLQQANCSVSAAGVVRGIHFADVPPGQAKYVTCLHGALLDVAVDIRVGSPTFGQWEAVLLDDVARRAVYLPEGIGHAFMSLQDGSVFAYLCSRPYSPGRERAVHPLDPAIGIAWPTQDRHGRPLKTLLSAKDQAAPSLTEAEQCGLLPSWAACRQHIATLQSPRAVPRPGPQSEPRSVGHAASSRSRQ